MRCVCCIIWFRWYCSHSRVSMMVADDLVPMWHQGICNHHDDISMLGVSQCNGLILNMLLYIKKRCLVLDLSTTNNLVMFSSCSFFDAIPGSLDSRAICCFMFLIKYVVRWKKNIIHYRLDMTNKEIFDQYLPVTTFHQWLNARLWYLHCIGNWDTTVWHKAKIACDLIYQFLYYHISSVRPMEILQSSTEPLKWSVICQKLFVKYLFKFK